MFVIEKLFKFHAAIILLSIILIKASCIMATPESALYSKSLAKRLKFCLQAKIHLLSICREPKMRAPLPLRSALPR
jgi:hypothetical protein